VGTLDVSIRTVALCSAEFSKMKSHSLTFSGALIERGFWLYVWHVTCFDKSIVYVGRTGDSSSSYAASPFNRLGQHLDVRESASANMLLRHMRKKGLQPTVGMYRMVAVGPIYREQETMELHRKHRNVVAAMEAALGRHGVTSFPVQRTGLAAEG
jgi:hypothetical protein